MKRPGPRLLIAAAIVTASAAIGWLAVQNKPDDVFRHSLEQLQQGDHDAALQGIKILDNHPGFESHVALLRGAYQLRRGLAADAILSFEAVDPTGELRLPALELTGECLFLLDQLPLAASQFQEILKDDPHSANAHRWLGQIFYNLGAFDTAVSHLQELITIEPDNYLAHALVGHMAFDFEDFQIAIQHYQKAQKLFRPDSIPDPVHQEVLRNLARSFIGQNKYPEALATLVTADPDHALVLALKADCHRGLGHDDIARQLLNQAIQMDPNERTAVLLQVDMALDSQQTAAIVKPLQRLLNKNPHDTACRYQLAQAWQRLGETNKYKQEMARHNASKELKRELTVTNLQANREPDNAAVRDRLAEICEALGKHDLARMWRQAAAACRRLPQTQSPQQAVSQ